jgi:uncharacterized Zn-binding protein involved in type VI secretion
MKKWASLLLSGVVAVGVPTSAFATGVNLDAGAVVNGMVNSGSATVQQTVTSTVYLDGKLFDLDGKKFEIKDNRIKIDGVVFENDGKVFEIGQGKTTVVIGGKTFVFENGVVTVNGEAVNLSNLVSFKLNGKIFKLGEKTVEIKGNKVYLDGKVFLIDGKDVVIGDGKTTLTIDGKTVVFEGDKVLVDGVSVDVKGKAALRFNGKWFKIGNKNVEVRGNNLYIDGNLCRIDGKIFEIGDGSSNVVIDGKTVLFSGGNILVGGVNAKVEDKVKKLKLKIDGVEDDFWKNAQIETLIDAKNGLKADSQLMYDDGNLYCLVKIDGAAKLWKDKKEAFLLSLFYDGKNGVDVDGEGYLMLSWPDMKVYANGAADGSFKFDKLVKSFSLQGDDVVLELKIPYENKDFIPLSEDAKIHLNLGLHGLQGQLDSQGQVVLPAIDLSTIKPDKLNELEFQWLVNLLLGAQADVDVDAGTGTGSTPGTGTGTGTDTGTGSGTGGTPSTGGSTGGGTGGTTGGGTAVGGVTDSGVIPDGMPQTGGGGASDWTD